MEINEKFCPVCKNKNERRAIVCINCGASLEDHHLGFPATIINSTTLAKIPVKITDSPIDDSLIPDDGIAIYAAGTLKPVYLWFDKELILGRKADGPTEGNMLDLSALGGHQAGISRRHAMILKREAEYEIVDLASTNGSWLNNERLVPNKPVPLASGSQLRFGQMQFLIVHHSAPKRKKSGKPG